MAKLTIYGQNKISTVKALFRETVGVDIQIYDQDGNPADETATLGSIRTKSPQSTEMNVVGQTLVKNVEKFFEENYGVKIDILNADGTLADNESTLGTIRRSYTESSADKEVNTDDMVTDMSQDDIVDKLVTEYKNDPRNKIIIEAAYLVAFAKEETGNEVTLITLCNAISSYEDGSASSEDEALVDAATALCHQVADRCWGECIDEDDDEWEEVDISTEWSDFDCDNPDDLFVTIYQD